MSIVAPAPDAPARAGVAASRDRVDVWVIGLEAGASGPALETLDTSERAFAARLRVGAGAWVAARAALRQVLGSCLGVAPGQVAFAAGPYGKPRLAAGAGPDLRFNLSHSNDVALVAVRLGHEVGVDVEAIRQGVDGAGIVRETFGPSERDLLADDRSPDAFFRAWVRREALAKATGRGIASPPDPDAGARFGVVDLDGIPGHAAALASEGTGWSVRRIGPLPAR